MLILFDHGTPAPLQSFLKGHAIREAKAQGWDTLGNGELLSVAEAAGLELPITTDRNLRYQQNLTRQLHGSRHPSVTGEERPVRRCND